MIVCQKVDSRRQKYTQWRVLGVVVVPMGGSVVLPSDVSEEVIGVATLRTGEGKAIVRVARSRIRETYVPQLFVDVYITQLLLKRGRKSAVLYATCQRITRYARAVCAFMRYQCVRRSRLTVSKHLSFFCNEVTSLLVGFDNPNRHDLERCCHGRPVAAFVPLLFNPRRILATSRRHSLLKLPKF